jgi:hypothetical protein
MSETDPADLDEIIAIALRMQAEAREVDAATLGPADIGAEWFEAAAAEFEARQAAAAVEALPAAPAAAPAPPPLSTGSVWGFAFGLVVLFGVCGAGIAVLVGATEIVQAQQRAERMQQEVSVAVDAAWTAMGQRRDSTVPLEQQSAALERASRSAPQQADLAVVKEAVEEWSAARAALDAAVAGPPGTWACAVGLVGCPQ